MIIGTRNQYREVRQAIPVVIWVSGLTSVDADTVRGHRIRDYEQKSRYLQSSINHESLWGAVVS